jgi:large conductance mechanosensitive channel
MSIFSEFQEFVSKGSSFDLAVGVIVGAAAGKVVSSFVNDLIMPLFSFAIGGANFANLFIDLSGKGYLTFAEAKAAGAPVFAYGQFISSLLDFTLILIAVFLFIQQMNHIRRTVKIKILEKNAANEIKNHSTVKK